MLQFATLSRTNFFVAKNAQKSRKTNATVAATVLSKKRFLQSILNIMGIIDRPYDKMVITKSSKILISAGVPHLPAQYSLTNSQNSKFTF